MKTYTESINDEIIGKRIKSAYEKWKAEKRPLINLGKGQLSEWTVESFSKEIGVQPPTYYSYANGTRPASVKILFKISQLCGVSVEYLLGLDKMPTPEQQTIHDATGLSEEACITLEEIRNDPTELKVLDSMLTSKKFEKLLSDAGEFNYSANATYRIWSGFPYAKKNQTEVMLDHFDDLINAPDHIDNAKGRDDSYKIAKFNAAEDYIDILNELYKSNYDNGTALKERANILISVLLSEISNKIISDKWIGLIIRVQEKIKANNINCSFIKAKPKEIFNDVIQYSELSKKELTPEAYKLEQDLNKRFLNENPRETD